MFHISNIIGSFVFDGKTIIEESLFSDADIIKNHSLILAKELPPVEAALARKHNAAPAGEKERERFIELMSQTHKERFYFANMLITKYRIKNSVKEDTLLMQAINNIDEIDKTANMLVKRLREWYELYNPEASKAIPDHEAFVATILSKDKQHLISEFAIPHPMGADIADKDVFPIIELARKVKVLYELRDEEKKYVEGLMRDNFPNIDALAGAQIGAKLIAQAGGIMRLSQFPSSTIQILGAEKALFRHMKTGARPPKYGILINHPMLSNSQRDDRGKIARAIANKLAIASKVDCNRGEFVGERLRQELESKFKR